MLQVPVQNINYGHPNLRDPKNKIGNRAWAKEHQMKIFAEDYEKPEKNYLDIDTTEISVEDCLEKIVKEIM